MAKIDFDEIRRHFPLPVYCEARGIRLKRSGRFLIGKCPIHQERSGEAFTIDPEAQRWRCRGKCSRGGDVIDLEQALGGGTPMEATARLIAGTSSWDAPTQPRSEQKPRSTSEWSWREHLRAGSASELRHLANHRDVAIEGVREAHSRGLLRFIDSLEGVAWVITDKTRQQAVWRRLDGKSWNSGAKAKLLPGCTGKTPIAVPEVLPFEAISIVEGGPDALACFGHAWADGCVDQLGVVCMPNTNADFGLEDARLLGGKRFRIFPHSDEAGVKAALRWCDQLEPIAAIVTIYQFAGLFGTDGNPVRDLNDLARIDYDSWEMNRSGIEGLMRF